MPQRLSDVDLSERLSKAESIQKITLLQRRLLHLRLLCGGLIGGGELGDGEKRLGPPLLVIMEGWDAAGKGGAIRRVVEALDPRHVTVAPFAAPTPRELRHHFMWRFFPLVPGWGGMTIFDRSWYGRVLVERVENLIEQPAWERSYHEIEDIETAFVEEGMVIVKLFLHLSDDEQLRRFEARRVDPLKSWKLTDEDWRNRGKRTEYVEAIDEMLARTDTPESPWDLIPGDSKHLARVRVLECLIRRLEAGMIREGMDIPSSKGLDYGT
jgi:polyphosphate kinase 2 (PPK2 family)